MVSKGIRGPLASPSRVTIADVAARAGVSPTTVSHALSGKRIVGEATRSRVMAAIEDLGYRPNSVARNLRTRRSQLVAVLVPNIADAFFGGLTRAVADAVDAAGYGMYVASTDGSNDREERAFQDVFDRGIDGIVVAPGQAGPQVRFRPAEVGTPIVSIGAPLDHPCCDVVMGDDEAGSRAATEHLIDRGRRRIAAISAPGRSGTAQHRGFLAAMSASGRDVEPRLVEPGDGTRAGGRLAMRALLAGGEQPDAVVCANDLMAIGAVDVVHQLGLEIPSDIAIVGFGDIDAATVVVPQLTTVDNASYEIGRTAGDLLVSRMTGRYQDVARTVVLPCALVVRDSG